VRGRASDVKTQGMRLKYLIAIKLVLIGMRKQAWNVYSSVCNTLCRSNTCLVPHSTSPVFPYNKYSRKYVDIFANSNQMHCNPFRVS
jgi:hypothetical protein